MTTNDTNVKVNILSGSCVYDSHLICSLLCECESDEQQVCHECICLMPWATELLQDRCTCETYHDMLAVTAYHFCTKTETLLHDCYASSIWWCST